jgi:hypothetical protein
MCYARVPWKKGGELLAAESAIFIKVTPRLFSRNLRLLLIGEKHYALPISNMSRGMGIDVNAIDEDSVRQLAQLKTPEFVRKKYDVLWLACFDSLWELMDDEKVDGIKQAASKGVGFIHSGGPGSFHGGFGRTALIDLRPLAEVSPETLRNRNDVNVGQFYRQTGDINLAFAPLKDIAITDPTNEGWSDFGLKEYGLPRFNDVQLKPGCQRVMSVCGRPLLVIGRFGDGTAVAFTGFTPAFTGRKSTWDPTIPVRYLVDQEFVTGPVSKAYFALLMRIIAVAGGEKAAPGYDDVLVQRDMPFFEMLKDLPIATLGFPSNLNVTVSGKRARATLKVTNGNEFARLVRVRAEWAESEGSSLFWWHTAIISSTCC